MLKIEFDKHNLTPLRDINYAVNYDNGVKGVEFILYLDEVDLTQFTPYIKIESGDKKFADKVPLVAEKLEDGRAKYTWTLLRKQSKHSYLRTQLLFEDALNDLVYQTPIIAFNISGYIDASSEIANDYPDILEYLQKQIDELGLTEKGDLHKNTYESTKDFPQTGESGQIYISLEDGAGYIWDEETYTYRCFARDYREIDTIIDTLY